MQTDIEIAQAAEVWPIEKIAEKAGLTAAEWEPYGRDKAKISVDESARQDGLGKLILVTSINPTPAGEGKSTVTVGLADALSLAGKKTMVALREPSLGPVMGLKGGATGGGYAQVVPMADINLHFTGDFHALTSAHNTLAAVIDNSIYQGNPLNIDPRRLLWKRALDVNDRALRHITIGLGGPTSGVPREDGFDITVASELMAILTLSHDLMDMKARIERIVIGYTYDKEPVTVKDLGVAGALTTLLKDAIKPNLVQTLAHTPTLIHGGPFANIAHGCNSVRATKLALKIADYAVTEAGFGADLGAEKFFDIKCRLSGLKPAAAVIVATVRALKYNGGVPKDELGQENMEALKKGIANLDKHIENIKKYGVPVVVTLNAFITDTQEEYEFIKKHCEEQGCEFALAKVWEKGGEGGVELAEKVLKAVEKPSEFKPLYKDEASLEEKIETVAKEIYGADGVTYSDAAKKELKHIEEMGFGNLPVCMAKTQYSLSDNPKLLGRPENFTINVREVYINAGAGFVVVLTGKVLTMPGLPKKPAAYGIDFDEENNKIVGLF